jgi:hypothetical protein
MSALRDALKTVKSEIVTIPAPVKPATQRPAANHRKFNNVVPLRPKQIVNGYEVNWAAQEDGQKIPYIQTERFYTQYPPSKPGEIKLPEGTVRATYNKEKRRVEFFKPGQAEPIRYVNDARHEPLPVPRYMGELEVVEEIFDIDFETGELTTGMRIDILPEEVHWKLRLQEFEAQQVKAGVAPKAITFRLQKHLKNLQATRGVTIEQLAKPIPQTILDAIDFAEEKMRKAVAGKK